MQIIIIVLFCHFFTAFTVLGTPLFLPQVINSFDDKNADYMIGILFVVPIICAAIIAPLWGKISDQYGKKYSLLRAQLGLMAGFLISGFSESLNVFILGLIIQGLTGGTLAASNAYLSAIYKGRALADKLNLTQLSTRFALIIAPFVLGVVIKNEQPLLIYRYLALLPFIAFLISLLLPKDKINNKNQRKNLREVTKSDKFFYLLVLQFLFCFSMVVTFPYFLPYIENLEGSSHLAVGFYYSFPNLIYLLLMFYMVKIKFKARVQSLLGFGILGSSCLGQFLIVNSDTLILYRFLFGVGMLLIYNGLHLSVSEYLKCQSTGLSFGRWDAAGKWAGVVAGICASFITKNLSLDYTFLMAVLSCIIAVIFLIKGDVKLLTK